MTRAPFSTVMSALLPLVAPISLAKALGIRSARLLPHFTNLVCILFSYRVSTMYRKARPKNAYQTGMRAGATNSHANLRISPRHRLQRPGLRPDPDRRAIRYRCRPHFHRHRPDPPTGDRRPRDRPNLPRRSRQAVELRDRGARSADPAPWIARSHLRY